MVVVVVVVVVVTRRVKHGYPAKIQPVDTAVVSTNRYRLTWAFLRRLWCALLSLRVRKHSVNPSTGRATREAIDSGRVDTNGRFC